MTVYIALLVWVGVATILSYIIERLWGDFSGWNVYRYALAPGIIVHEASHCVGCLLTGAKIRQVTWFSRTGGQVVHTKPKMPLLGQPIISLAPIAGCTLALWGVWGLFGARLGLGFDVSALSQAEVSGAVLWQVLQSAFTNWFGRLFSSSFISLEGFVFLYFVLTFSICMAPSRTDLRHALFGLLAMAAIFSAIQVFGLSLLGIELGWTNAITLFGLKAFTFSIMLLMSALAVSVPAALLAKIFRK